LCDFLYDIIPELTELKLFRHEATVHKKHFTRQWVDFQELILIFVDVFADPPVLVKVLSAPDYVSLSVQGNDFDVCVGVVHVQDCEVLYL